MAEAMIIIGEALTIQDLTSQITHSITKLRSYYDQIQDGPKRFENLLEEAEDLQRFIEDYEQPLASAQIQDTATLLRSLERYKTCVDQLIQLTDSVSLDIQTNGTGRKRWFSVKAGLKKDKKEIHMLRLEHAMSLLCLSCEMHAR